MTYAHRKDIYDADTHMMEHPNWIYDFADEDIKEHLEPVSYTHLTLPTKA